MIITGILGCGKCLLLSRILQYHWYKHNAGTMKQNYPGEQKKGALRGKRIIKMEERDDLLHNEGCQEVLSCGAQAKIRD
jgi:hypothetical protein